MNSPSSCLQLPGLQPLQSVYSEIELGVLCTPGKHSTPDSRGSFQHCFPLKSFCALCCPQSLFPFPAPGPLSADPRLPGLASWLEWRLVSAAPQALSPLANLFPTRCLPQPVCTAGAGGEDDNYLMRPHNADSQLKYP